MSFFSINIIHFISLTLYENTISALFCRFVCLYHPVLVLLSFNNDKWLKYIAKQCSVFYLRYCVLAPNNVVKYGAIAMAGRFSGREMPLFCLLMYLIRSNLKVTRKFAKTPLGCMTGEWIFSRNFCSPPQHSGVGSGGWTPHLFSLGV